MTRALSPLWLLPFALLLSACGDGSEGYPALRPIEELTAEPQVPADAAGALADPYAVQDELRARAAAAKSRAPSGAAISDRAGLDARAEALRRRAGELRRADPGADAAAPPCPAVPSPDRPDCAPVAAPAT